MSIDDRNKPSPEEYLSLDETPDYVPGGENDEPTEVKPQKTDNDFLPGSGQPSDQDSGLRDPSEQDEAPHTTMTTIPTPLAPEEMPIPPTSIPDSKTPAVMQYSPQEVKEKTDALSDLGVDQAEVINNNPEPIEKREN